MRTSIACLVFALTGQLVAQSMAEVRSILAARCFVCHGPDTNKRKGGAAGTSGLRLDTKDGLLADHGGRSAVVPGDSRRSELWRRITSTGKDRMPPVGKGAALPSDQIERIARWIDRGAAWKQHWSDVPLDLRAKAERGIDAFVRDRLRREGLDPADRADPATLLRRVTMDLTGLPPTPGAAKQFLHDRAPGAYERLVDRLLASPAFGEHWARPWLDLARYADSAGYADDPPRTIWAWRDWVIRRLNENQPFDQFTVEQLAGDLLPNPTEEQLVATAFHRNTMTNSEGGTDDEEFRSAAIADRVNTTMAVWMGTTAGCAECHTHKYDPLTQREYYGLYAFFNNTEDSDKRDERPTLKLYSAAQRRDRAKMENDIASLERVLAPHAPRVAKLRRQWDAGFPRNAKWKAIAAHTARKGGAVTRLRSLPSRTTAIRLATQTGRKPRVTAALVAPRYDRARGRYVRVELPGKRAVLHLAEVQVFDGATNVARTGKARQISTGYGGRAERAIDGNTNGHYAAGKSTSHTGHDDDPWWEVDLGAERALDRIVVWNRTDSEGVRRRLRNFRVRLLDDKRETVWSAIVAQPPKTSVELGVSPFPAVTTSEPYRVGNTYVVLLKKPLSLTDDSEVELRFELDGKPVPLREVSVTTDRRFPRYARLAPRSLAQLAKHPRERNAKERRDLELRFPQVVATLGDERQRLAALRAEITRTKPSTTVPIMRERMEKNRRKTHIHLRGNFMSKGAEVEPHLPAMFPPLPAGAGRNRLGLARWLVSPDNPRTARVAVNRIWELLFGIGLVRTSEDFGVQGERPSHPRLLDRLASVLVRSGWDIKALIRRVVVSETYRQSSRADLALLTRDPDNRLLARGPRFRLSAEMIRDQALALSGLLSRKMYGPPVRPPRPRLGLRAAFGGSTDWATSKGQDRYRRAIYTNWRRSIPYPSMATFDAPNRDVCTVHRIRTNTPLQALVTLNDPVFVEAAQALARRIVREGGPTTDERAGFALRLCLVREPRPGERARLARLFSDAHARYSRSPAQAKAMAEQPLGPIPKGADPVELAAWTVVANVLLNLDEILTKR